jgi:hypothetical protein
VTKCPSGLKEAYSFYTMSLLKYRENESGEVDPEFIIA